MSETRPAPDRRDQGRHSRDGWAEPPPDRAFEASDAPFGSVARGLALGGASLVLIVAGVVLGSRWIAGPPPLSAPAAVARFRAPTPPLLAEPRQSLAEVERAHPAPSGARQERAMDAVIASGWNPEAPPPDRAQTALARARALP